MKNFLLFSILMSSVSLVASDLERYNHLSPSENFLRLAFENVPPAVFESYIK